MEQAYSGLVNTMNTYLKNTLIPGFVAATALLFASCTSVPTQIQGDYAQISPARVQASDFGTTVRWGGVLVDTRNERNQTCFEVLSHDLNKGMRPIVDDTTAGRFIACTNGFYDPEVYAKGREVTIVGQIDKIEERNIEEFDYRYPVLAVNDLVLWEVRKTVMVYNGFYNPYYYPYYWSGGPYWGYYPYYRYPGPVYGVGMGFGGYAYPRQLEPDASTILTNKP